MSYQKETTQEERNSPLYLAGFHHGLVRAAGQVAIDWREEAWRRAALAYPTLDMTEFIDGLHAVMVRLLEEEQAQV